MLWKKLQSNDITNTDFVGSQKAPDCGFPYDGDNEGHAGALAIEYAQYKNLTGWLASAQPDVILMHLGTNDVIQGKSVQDTLTAYGTLVDEMRASKASMQILVSVPCVTCSIRSIARSHEHGNEGHDQVVLTTTAVLLVDSDCSLQVWSEGNGWYRCPEQGYRGMGAHKDDRAISHCPH